MCSDDEYLEATEFEPETEFEIMFQYDPEGVCSTDIGNSIGIKDDNNSEGSEVQHHCDIILAEEVTRTGKFNFQQARIPVKSGWNIELLTQLLQEFEDKQVVEFLQFGWPIDRDDSVPLPRITGRNHKGALDFAEAVDAHIEKELQLNALAGPFNSIPMKGFTCSPINTRPKRDSDKRRIIYNLSWEPKGNSVNAGIDKRQYVGEPVKLRYPTVFTLINCIKQLKSTSNEDVLLFKRDWARAFSQLPLDPSAYRYVGFKWKGKYYFSKVVPMGLVSACLACQRTSSAMRHIMNKMGFYLCNYIDDMASAELASVAHRAFGVLGRLFRDLGVQESVEKAVAPTTEMEFVGNLLNTQWK